MPFLFQNIPRNRVESVQKAIATQDPPKEKRDKEILEEDYKSYESKDADNVAPPNDHVDAQNVAAAGNNDNDNVAPVDNVVNEVVRNDINDLNKINDNKDGYYPENGDSNNAEETYHDFDENGVKVENTGFRKAVVPDFKGPTNDRQEAVVAAFQHAWNGYKKFAWGHDHLR